MDAKGRDKLRRNLEPMSTPRLRAIRSGVFHWQPEAVEIAGEILEERGIRSSAVESCPICHGELERGSVMVHGTLPGFLLIGFSYQHLWFYPEDGGAKEIHLHSRHSRSACRCVECGMLLVEG